MAGILPGDVLARYYRAKGEDVLYVSGSDCHGTPVEVQAAQEGVEPSTIADRYHREFMDCFARLGFTYDLYTRTNQDFHHRVAQEFFLELLNNGFLYKKTVQQTYCETDERFLPDRYVEGHCPVCGHRARGDQCDFCSTLLEPSELSERICKLCGHPPVQRSTEHYYFSLSQFQMALTRYAEEAQGWKENAVQLTHRYLAEGLQDRAATRDLSWGVAVPLEGFEGKKIYVWVEAVIGYLSASRQWASESGSHWEPFWIDGEEELTAYYVHGKDNIPFHTLIWPALLMGAGGYHLPDRIVSSEYMTLEGRKFSTSRNWAVWVPDMLEKYQPDSIRYFLIANGPEKRDTDFSWREFIHSHNGELLGAFGNFVNRTLAFIEKAFEGRVPPGALDEGWTRVTEKLYSEAGKLIEDGHLKEALERIFAYVRQANKFFDEQKPWLQLKSDREGCGETLYVCVQIIGNLAHLLQPFTPFVCEKIRSFFRQGKPGWTFTTVSQDLKLQKVELLFERLDVKRINEELGRLKEQNARNSHDLAH